MRAVSSARSRDALFIAICVSSAVAIAGCSDPATTAGGDAGAAIDGGRERDGGRGGDAGRATDGGDVLDASATDGGAPIDAGRDAGPEPCDTPGTSETVPCGMCGTIERFCTAARAWAYGTCTGEGECAPGASRSVACGNCGAQMQRCGVTCEWADMGACGGEGECAPGATTRSGAGCPMPQTRELTCSDACVFEPSSACSADGCPMPGAIETLPCGMCGTMERFCTAARVWEYDACIGEGACMPGTSGTLGCGMCGTRAARCTDTCTYVPAAGSTCMGEGVCMPGQTMRTTDGCPPGQRRLVRCDDACGFSIEVEACRSSYPVDVLYLIDATPSNWSQFQSGRTTFVPRCVDAMLAITDVAVGIAYYGDLSPPPETFAAGVEIATGTSTAIDTSIMTRSDLGGAEDSTMEALHIVTGGTAQPGAVPFVCSAGRTAGGCWRAGARRVVVMHTDEIAKGGPDPASSGLFMPWPTGPNWTTVLPRMRTDAVTLFVVLDDDTFGTGDPLGSYREMVTDLGQPMTDVMMEPVGAGGVGGPCDAIVARVRTIAGM